MTLIVIALRWIGFGSPKIEFWDLKVPEKSSNNY